MRNLLFILLLSVSFTTQANLGYKARVEVPIAGLGFSKSEISSAVQEALKHYRWSVAGKTDTSITANIKGRTPIDIDFSSDQKITIGYRTKKTEHKLNRRLMNLRRATLINLTDCKINSTGELDAATKQRRNVVHSLLKARWDIKSVASNRIIGKSPGNGRVEVDIDSDGNVKMQRWDEMESEYTDPGSDRYLQKVKKVYNGQLSKCSK